MSAPLPAYSSVDLAQSGDPVHVWWAFLEQAGKRIECFAEVLSTDEHTRAGRFRFSRDRKRFVVRRGILRMILGRYLGVEPRRLRFRYASFGKPSLDTNTGAAPLRFNMSHSQDLALYAVTRDREVGVDLEIIRPIPEAEQIAKRYYSSRENAVLHALPGAWKQRAFFNGWTRKEAYLKALGDGLSRPLEKFDVSLVPGEPARLLQVDGYPEEPARWALRELTPYPGYVAALAVEGRTCRVACRQWTP